MLGRVLDILPLSASPRGSHLNHLLLQMIGETGGFRPPLGLGARIRPWSAGQLDTAEPHTTSLGRAVPAQGRRKEGRKEVMGFLQSQEVAEWLWFLAQCPTSPAMGYSSCQSPRSPSNGASGTTALGSSVQNKLGTKSGGRRSQAWEIESQQEVRRKPAVQQSPSPEQGWADTQGEAQSPGLTKSPCKSL